MTAFVILAAGRGTRVGRVGGGLHKALLPLDGKAVLSHLIERGPPDARIIICVGDRAEQIYDYVELAHPELDVTFANVPNWDGPGSGPGRSLLAARLLIGDDDMVFTSCDTLWTQLDLWDDMSTSWAAYAPMPAGTEPQRWCRLCVYDGVVTAIYDKVNIVPHLSNVYVGLAHVKKDDIPVFWNGVSNGPTVEDEVQVTGGLNELRFAERLRARRIDWIDTGDEAGYRRAVAEFAGYDWTKSNQATYVLPKSGRVVKYMADRTAVATRWARGRELKDAVPTHIARRTHMLAYAYVEGETVYEYLEHNDKSSTTRRLLEWRDFHLTTRVAVKPDVMRDTLIKDAVHEFYRVKTIHRIDQLRASLRDEIAAAHAAVESVKFNELVLGFEPGMPHGDFNYGNVIVTPEGDFVGIDWREDFAGSMWFDLRYDMAKLLAGTVVHWGRARRGDFTPWDMGPHHADVIRDYLGDKAHDVEVIAALSLINSAPLHAAPLDEILVARGCAWLERLM